MTQRSLDPLAVPFEHHKLGIPAAETQVSLQSDFYRELVSKLAWAIGSTYGKPYNNTRCPARVLAAELARDAVARHGYGGNIKI